MTCFAVHWGAAISDQRLNGLIGRDATSGSQEKKMGTASFEYYQSSRERFLAGLTNLLKIPSISTLPEHRSDVRRACEFLADELRAMSMQQVDIIEGEEEVGGEHIEQYVRAHPDRLQADAAVICDTEMFAPELPTITTGLRGLVYTELEARGAAHDLHSGMYGGAAPNPFQALAEI